MENHHHLSDEFKPWDTESLRKNVVNLVIYCLEIFIIKDSIFVIYNVEKMTRIACLHRNYLVNT